MGNSKLHHSQRSIIFVLFCS